MVEKVRCKQGPRRRIPRHRLDAVKRRRHTSAIRISDCAAPRNRHEIVCLVPIQPDVLLDDAAHVVGHEESGL